MIPDAILDDDSEFMLNALIAIFVIVLIYLTKLFLARQLRVPGMKHRYGFPVFRSQQEYEYLGYLVTQTEKKKLEASSEFKHMTTLRGGLENEELWNWQTRSRLAHQEEDPADGDVYSVGSLEFENENPGLGGKS